MSYQALYRKWRPLRYEDVVEQSYIVQTLKNAILSNRIGHAYLFCGSRGTGKTTMAKIFSRAINCLQPTEGDPCNTCPICHGILSGRNLDVIEIDAASNNGVENIREIRDEVVYTPTESRYKTYIIDEVHMLSTGAFNALLKTLEEPPPHVVFILATTEPHKLPATILSRCQRFDFRRISADGIADRLHIIAAANAITLSPDSAKLIARLAEGGMRDAISLLDQCIASGNNPLTSTDIMNIVGLAGHDFVLTLADALIQKKSAEIFSLTQELVNSGRDIKHVLSEVILYFRDLLLLKLTQDIQSMTYPLYADTEKLKQLAASLETDFMMAMIRELSTLENHLKWSRNTRVFLEIGLLKICERKLNDPLDHLQARISELEEKLSKGSFVPSGTSTPLPSSEPSHPSSPASDKKKTALKRTKQQISSFSPEQAVPFWQDLVQETASMGRMQIYLALQASNAYFSSENVITVVTDFSIQRDALSKAENISILETLANKRLGHPVRIKIQGSSVSSSEIDPAEFPGVTKAMELAKKANIPLNIIDA